MIFSLVVGEAVFIFLILFFIWFLFTSLREKEERSSWRSLYVLVLVVMLNIVLWLLPFTAKTWAFGAAAILFFIFSLWILFSPSPKKTTEIVGVQDKIDERDVIFARFDLEQDSEKFQDYYLKHPEYAAKDKVIRKFPDVLTPDHLKKNPILFSLADAEFDFLEHLLTQVTGSRRTERLSFSPEGGTKLVKNILRFLGSDDCGICLLDQAYVYSHVGRGPEPYGQRIELNHRYAIVFAVKMEFAMISTAPLAPVIVETGQKYVEAAKISVITANFIRRLGYPARAHIAGSNYQAVLPPLGWKAGLGEVGRLGILITTKYGPRARLGLITTDFPLLPDKPKSWGIIDFCEKCQKCAKNCPAQAIPLGDKTEEKGAVKWVLNREECYKYWRKAGTDCSVCIYVCPFSKPANPFHNTIRKATSQFSTFLSLSVWGDDFFYGRKPLRKKSPL
jgi:ferredoxin